MFARCGQLRHRSYRESLSVLPACLSLQAPARPLVALLKSYIYFYPVFSSSVVRARIVFVGDYI